MRTVRLPLLRGALFIIALAAIAFIMARGDNPASATSYDPHLSISVSDPNPGAAADIKIDFSLDGPDAFPNVRTNPAMQFIPRSWGVHSPETDGANAAPIGSYAGTFNALATLGVFGISPCLFATPVPFTMYDASVDTSYTTSPLDLGAGEGPGGSDLHPGGAGFSGQFVQDPDYIAPPSDLGLPLTGFNPDETVISYDPGETGSIWLMTARYYRDVNGDGLISVGDLRLLTVYRYGNAGDPLPAGSTVQQGDWDVPDNNGTTGYYLAPLSTATMFGSRVLHAEIGTPNGVMDVGEGVYVDHENSGTVSYGDSRGFFYYGQQFDSTVEDLSLPAGVRRYPGFLNQIFPPEVVGEPLSRQFGATQVITTPVSMNIVTFRPGQLPGYPASLGYPNVVVLLNPVAPVEPQSIGTTSDLCAPLSLTSTNFGVSQDNPNTWADESGYVRLTNPKAEKSHEFTLMTASQPDADDDGIENMLDTCALDPNVDDLDGRNNGLSDTAGGPDRDALDGACDPDPARPGVNPVDQYDEDVDGYRIRADNCPVVKNGVEILGSAWINVPGFQYAYGITGSPIGPDNQVDTDGDDIGDACEGAEHGGALSAAQQCVNAADDDGDGAINDGCPSDPGSAEETGAQCDNAVDDDGDGLVNDGCPMVRSGGVYESGAQCDNATDDDGDGLINDGCPSVSGIAETGDQCLNNTDDDGDGLVNDGCPKVTGGSPESGDQCLNDTDDDADGLVNDGCPGMTGTPESGDQCANNVDDDGDGLVNDGCPSMTGTAESGDQCANATDDDGDGLVNDGCPSYSWGEWQCNDALDNDDDGYANDGCPVNGVNPESYGQCNNNTDDDTDGYVNDGCPLNGPWGEWGAQCRNAVDDDTDGYVNDGCPYGQGYDGDCSDAVDGDGDGVVNDGCPVNGAYGEYGPGGIQCKNDVDDDGDGKVNDGCPRDPLKYEERNWAGECANDTDDDGDGKVNDGCPTVVTLGATEGQCANNVNDDSSDDSYINDGCPPVGEPESGDQCGNLVDDDGDDAVNDGCPVVGSAAEIVGCDNDVDDDGDGLVNDGCPAVDPGDVAKTTITGHMHFVTLKQGVQIAKHGIKLDDLDGKEKVASGGSGSYTVSIENKDADDAQDTPVALRVVEGCAKVDGADGQNSTVLTVPGDASGNATFNVDWSGCPDGEYTVQADACHAGDPAPSGFFGDGGCPGADPHVQQPPSGPLTLSEAIASSEAFGAEYGAAKAIDSNTESLWCTGFEPGVNIQASFSSAVSIDRVDIEDSYGALGYAFVTGTLTFSNGYTQDVTLTAGAGSFSVPLQSGVTWVKFTATSDFGWGAGCISELKAFGFIPPTGDSDLLDDAPRSITVVVGTP